MPYRLLTTHIINGSYTLYGTIYETKEQIDAIIAIDVVKYPRYYSTRVTVDANGNELTDKGEIVL